MGITYIHAKVVGPKGEVDNVRLLVDSGATYTLLPKDICEAIGLQPKRELQFFLADGTTINRSVSECQILLPEGEGHTPVIMGQEGDHALLGVVTLEILGLVFNPFNRTLQQMKMMLA